MVSAADLDALDRGVVEAGMVAAEALSRIAALEATVAELARRVEQATTAGILRQAGLPSAPAERASARPHHLKTVK